MDGKVDRSIQEILIWQWNGYDEFHKTQKNLIIHILANPLFIIGNILAVIGLFNGNIWGGIVGVLTSGISMKLQGLGHTHEPVRAIPFTGIKNAITRIFLEQWITFPRFVISGKWYRQLCLSKKK